MNNDSAHPSRRALARGAAWSIPALSIAAAAPALAASPCSAIKPGQPLPASLFQAYFSVTLQTAGGLLNKVDVFIAGIWLDTTSPSAVCVPSGTDAPRITSFALNTSDSGTMTLTNDETYSVYGGAGIAGTGTLGTKKGACSGPNDANADACNTYTGNSLRNSSGTSRENPKSAALNYSVTVAGYGTTQLTLIVPSFQRNGTHWDGQNVIVS